MLKMKCSLLYATVLICSLLVIYCVINKSERGASSIFLQMCSPTKNDFPENKESIQKAEVPTTLSSSAEDLFKLYDGVETFVMFIGYPRSRHSLVAAILDAHPEIIIANEYHVLRTWEEKFRSSKEVERSFKKYQLFYDLHELSVRDATFGLRANNSLLDFMYSYQVPGLWQGRYFKGIKVIGDKKGGGTANALRNKNRWSVLYEIQEVLQIPIKFIHVIRNPFDNIATIMLHATESRDVVKEDGVMVNMTEELDLAIKSYFSLAAANQRIRERYGNAVIDIQGHNTVLKPRETLQRLCDHLGVTCSEDYFEKCSSILFGVPSVTRDKVVWTKEQKEQVTKQIKNFSFLKEYSFDEYPK
ncbi:uncharacterized protein [Pocillopora verrucosa]|uniref:uncharacterized protein n=1 Tax=Pocillopora verrucosa TaxID=203993 RepID=UPI003341568E